MINEEIDLPEGVKILTDEEIAELPATDEILIPEDVEDE